MVISERRLLANRLNALKSTGPRTPDGKARVRKNRIRHGLQGVDPVLPEECIASYQLFEREVQEHLDPRWPVEVMLSQQICSLLWRLRRVGRMEVRVFEQALEHPSALKCDTTLDALARQLIDQPDHALMTMSRYERSLRNALLRTLSEYRRVKEAFGAPRPCRDYDIAPVKPTALRSVRATHALELAPPTVLSAAQDDELVGDAHPTQDALPANELTVQTQRQARRSAPQLPAQPTVTSTAKPENPAPDPENQTHFGPDQTHSAADQTQPAVTESPDGTNPAAARPTDPTQPSEVPMKARSAVVGAVLAMSLLSGANARNPLPPDPRGDAQPTIQIALLLDTSNSMDGLINQARSQLWKIVNEFNGARKNGQAPKLQVALYEYGNNNLAAGEGYIRMVLPLTTDLDMVSEKLWSLKTNGGSEYCGHVIHNAAKELSWSDNKDVYRAIFIAGNEPFTQGNVDFRSSCAEALAKGIVVNTIHCGPENVGREGKWNEGATLGEGKFLNIDQDKATVAIATPHDEPLAKLSSELNKTYVPYGAEGRLGLSRQESMDQKQQNSQDAAERANAKASASYTNAGWDMVDAVKDGKVKVEELSDKDLPDAMQKMSVEERKRYIAERLANRTDLQKKIAELNAQRQKFLEEKQKEQGTTGADTLDTAIIKAVREQLQAKDYKTE